MEIRMKVLYLVIVIIGLALIIEASLGVTLEQSLQTFVGSIIIVFCGVLCVESAYAADSAKKQGSHGED
jgi:hypothetical protein